LHISFYRLCANFSHMEKKVAKTTIFVRTLGKLAIGPIAGAAGLWLLAEAPAVHAAMCSVN